MKWLWVCGITLALVVSGVVLYASPAQADSGAPAMTHSLSGRDNCLSCHGPNGARPAPQNHILFANATCFSCHAVAATTSNAGGCLDCHNKPGLTMTLSGGEILSVTVNAQGLAASVHGNKLLCGDCHKGITGYPHPKVEAVTRRAFSVTQYELCKACHFVNYTKTLDSIHYKLQAQGDLKAPLCTDCHGAHDVTVPAQPRKTISTTCSKCHQGVYKEYAASVHGKALITDNNYDVPVCTDCHTAHTIADPLTASFRLQSVELCSNCHGNAKLMDKYSLSTSVVKTYLADFHGKSVALIGEQGKDIWAEQAVCTDCHGVHNIQKVDDASSPVFQQNLSATCQKCHATATANFTGAWLSHYEPTVQQAPLVFFIGWMYKILIPFIVIGFSIHILLDIWRTVTNR